MSKQKDKYIKIEGAIKPVTSPYLYTEDELKKEGGNKYGNIQHTRNNSRIPR